MADRSPQFLQTRQAESGKPVIERLYGQRYRVTRRLDAAQGVKLLPELFADYGTADIGDVSNLSRLENLSLIKTGMPDSDRTAADKRVLVLVYETLTGQLVDEVKPVVDYEMNGLKRVTCRLIGLPDIDLDDYDFTVGESVYLADGGLVLAQFKDESDDAATRITVVYLEPGVISKGEQPGSIAGTTEHSWVTWLLDATNEAEMGAGNTIPGKVLSRNDDNVSGYKVRRYNSLGGTITGVKLTYADVLEQLTPGTVVLESVAVTAGDLTGTLAVINHTPPRQQKVDVTVTVEITTAPPTTITARAFNLGAISCSVRSRRASFNFNGTDVFETTSQRFSGARKSASISAGIQTFPNCYIVGPTSASGSFSYDAGWENTSTSLNSIVAIGQGSVDTTRLDATGATAATGYTTTGIIERKSRPVLTALDGTIYHEVITWSA